MANILTYAQMARVVYQVEEADSIEGYSIKAWEAGSWYGNGFQGGIYVCADEVICAFKGTKPGVFGKKNVGFSDLSADLRIGLGILPNQTGSAFKMCERAKAMAKGRPVTVVVHSLGGALAQVAATWSNLPFVSFNSPGMKYEIKLSCFNFIKPMQMIRSWRGPSGSTISGWNFRIIGDPVSAFGHHVGVEVELNPPQHGMGMLAKHSMDAVIDALGRCEWGGMEAFYF